MIRLPVIITGLILLSLTRVFGQTSNDKVLLEKLALYSKANPSGLLFVHTDKTIYTNNETVWFSAYLIKSGPVDLKRHTILSVAVIREDNRRVYLQDKYVMENGLSFGSLNLPDTIPPGNYQFIASTNIWDKNARPVVNFSQQITVKSITEPNFEATLSLLDTSVNNGNVRVNVMVMVKDADPKQKQKPSIEYNVSKGASRSVILNESNYVINVPAAELNQSRPVLLTSVKYKNQVQYLSLKLPEIRSEGITIRFFPEGGNLSDGLESTVGWEAKTARDAPVALKGILYKDDRPVDTIATNSYGIGTFRLKPDRKSKYTLKVAANPYLNQETFYSLPKVFENGVVMHIADAVINDTLRVSLFSRQGMKVKLFIHNYQEAFAAFETEATPSGNKINIFMPIIPKGLATITVLDMLGRPLAERIFFAHRDQKITGSIVPDKPVYNKKDSVHIKVRLSDQYGVSVPGIISVAAVQDNRIEGDKEQDIESYVYLNHDLGYLPRDPQGRGFNNKNYLEDILLVKGWRRYTWQGLMDASVSDTILQTQSAVIRGNVKYYDKELKKPVRLSIIRDSLIDLITTEPDGSFLPDREKLIATEGRKVFLMVGEKNNNGYTITVDDPFITVNQQLADLTPVPNRSFAPNVQNSSELLLKGFERAIALQTVTIKANKSDDFLYGSRGAGPNACGDYVCRFNILNCRNHPFESDNRPPVEGQSYQGKTYSGCILDKDKEEKISDVRGIYTSREFYGVNGDPAGLKEIQYFSTLFWKPGILLNKQGESEFSFLTGDITGKFRIVIQGVSEKDMIFAEGSFMVK
jgi:hypothetical protein